MTGGCLGDVLAALVDGELEHAARERAHRHLAHCPGCRAEVEAQRRLKARLSGSDEPALSTALTDRLLRLAAPVEEPALHSRHDVRPPPRLAAGTPASSRPAGSSPVGPRPTSARPGRVVRRRATTGSALALLGVAAALALGAPQPRTATTLVDPTTDAFLVEHVSTTADGPSSAVVPVPAARTARLTTFVPLTRAALLSTGGTRTTR